MIADDATDHCVTNIIDRKGLTAARLPNKSTRLRGSGPEARLSRNHRRHHLGLAGRLRRKPHLTPISPRGRRSRPFE